MKMAENIQLYLKDSIQNRYRMPERNPGVEEKRKIYFIKYKLKQKTGGESLKH